MSYRRSSGKWIRIGGCNMVDFNKKLRELRIKKGKCPSCGSDQSDYHPLLDQDHGGGVGIAYGSVTVFKAEDLRICPDSYHRAQDV
jgi:hypothetical protein